MIVLLLQEYILSLERKLMDKKLIRIMRQPSSIFQVFYNDCFLQFIVDFFQVFNA